MELKINSPSFKHADQNVNNQTCINYFLSPAGISGKSDPTKMVSLPTPGKRLMVDLSGNEVRGLITIQNTVYAVCDRSVYKLTINDDAKTATSTLIGTITTSETGPVSIIDNKTQIMIADGTPTGGYIITQATDTFSQITDEDFLGASSVVFMDGYFIYSKPSSAFMYATAINDGTSVSALDVTEAEANPDIIVGLGVSARELWAFGEKSIEIYYDAANATGFPFSRRDGASMDIGCAAAKSILNVDNSLFWLDNRGFICRAEQYTPKVISDGALSAAIKSYSRVSDAVAFQHSDRGGLFYVISFPTAKKTWAYDMVTQLWHERAYFTQDDNFEHDLINCQTIYKQFDIVGARNSGKIGLLDHNTFTDFGDPIHRLVRTQHEVVEFNLIACDVLELEVSTGESLVTDPEPMIVMRYSNDGGHTWSYELPRSLGGVGTYNKPVTWNRLGTAKQWQFEFRTTIPQKHALIRACVTVSGGTS